MVPIGFRTCANVIGWSLKTDRCPAKEHAMRRVMVRYRVKPGQAEANEQLVRDVYEELAQLQPDGFHYGTFKLDDGVTFVHLATHEADANPLGQVAAFAPVPGEPARPLRRAAGGHASWRRSGRSGSPGCCRERRRHQGRPLEAEDAAAHVGLRDVPRRARRTGRDRVRRGQDDPALRRAGDRRPARDAQGRAATGSTWAAPTSRSRRRTAPSRRGAARPTTRWAAGTG